MMLIAILRTEPVEKWIQVEDQENQRGKKHSGEENFRNEPTAEMKVDARKETHRALNPSEIPIGLRAGKNGGRIVGAVDPDRIDLNQTAETRNEREDKEEEAERFKRVGGPDARADDGAIRAHGSGIVGVILTPDDEEMDGDEHRDKRGYKKNMENVEARYGCVHRNGAAKEQLDQPRADEGNRQENGVANAQACAGKQIGTDGITEETVGKSEHEKSEADEPVNLAGTTVSGGEENAEEMGNDGADEDVGGPVMHLTHEKARTNLEAEMKNGLVGGGHGNAIKSSIGPVIDDFVSAAIEEQSKERSCDDENDEGVERNFAKHE